MRHEMERSVNGKHTYLKLQIINIELTDLYLFDNFLL